MGVIIDARMNVYSSFLRSHIGLLHAEKDDAQWPSALRSLAPGP